MASTVNILHISDLHYRKREFSGQTVILDAFKKDLQALCEGALKPDFIVFTGDLVHSADDPDAHLYLYDEFISEISKITRCHDSSFYLCPGNHDAHREATRRHLNLQTGFEKNWTGRDSLNDQYLSQSKELIVPKFEKFNELRDLLGASTSFDDGITAVYPLADFPLSIIACNTAWMTGTGIDSWKKDERRLLVPEASLMQAMRSVPQNQNSILITHHPLNWLTEFCESDLLDTIDDTIVMHLFGHMHEVRPSAVADLKGKRITHQSGALYTGRQRYNGYAILSVDLETHHVAIHLRSYFDKRREFDAGIDIAKTGTFYSSTQSEAFWYSRGRRVDRAALRTWITNTMQPAAATTWNEGIIDRPVGDVFVPPPMYTKRVIKDSDAQSVPTANEEFITIENIVPRSDNFNLFRTSRVRKNDADKANCIRDFTVCIAW